MFIGKKLLDPKNDYVFKRIFGFVGNEDITKGLLNAILDNVKIQSLTLDCKEILEQDLKTDKFGVLDIRAVIDNSIQCDIEMQMVDRKNIENRLLYYWSKLYSKTIHIGEDYIKGQRTIIILFSNYELDILKDIQKYLTKWHICEDELKNIVLTNNLEIYIIEMTKYRDDGKNENELSTWLKFIKNPEVLEMDEIKNNESLEKAKKVLEEISEDEKEQYLAEQRLMYIMDQKAIEAAGFDKGFAKGKTEGKIEGKTEGKIEERKEIAKKMLRENIEITMIVRLTGLKEEEIKELK